MKGAIIAFIVIVIAGYLYSFLPPFLAIIFLAATMTAFIVYTIEKKSK